MKKILLASLAAVMITSTTIQVHASTVNTNKNSNDISTQLNENEIEAINNFNDLFIKKGLGEKIKITEEGTIYFDEQDLAALTKEELNFVSSIMQTSSIYPYLDESLIKERPQSRIAVRNWRIYFTYSEVRQYFSGAAAIGPHAVYAAMVALGSVIGGPLGTGITALLGAVGGTILYTNVIKALNSKRGMYIGFTGCGVA